MKIFNFLNKIQNSMMVPFLIGSAIIVIYESATLLDIYVSGAVTETLLLLANAIKLTFEYSVCYFLVMMLTSGKRWIKAFISLFCYICFHTAFASVTQLDRTYFFALLLGFIYSLCYNNFNKYFAAAASLILSLLLGYSLGFVTEHFNDLVSAVSDIISEKGLVTSAVFGAVNGVFSIFDSSIFSDFFFYKSNGGAIIYNDSLVTGAVDLFSSGYSGRLVSQFLSGKFYLLFALSGLAFSVGNELKGVQKNTLVIITACAVLSGNISLLLLFLILENVAIILPVIFLSVVSYLSAYLLDLSAGYIADGGIVEMAMALNGRWVYLIAGGIVILALGYFSGKLFLEKRGISDCMNIYIPTRLNAFVKSLGGVENIIRIKESKIELRNPQLVNLLSCDYELKDNVLIIDKNLVMDLEEYLN